MAPRNIAEWQDFITGCLDFRPKEGVFRIAREMFTEAELFDLEMELIFEKVWIYRAMKPYFFYCCYIFIHSLIVTYFLQNYFFRKIYILIIRSYF